MRTAIYTRISQDSTGQQLGVQRQLDDCLALAERFSWEVVARYNDNDISAYGGRTRPGYQALCAALDAGKAQAVLAWHTDRLHRRPIEMEGFIDLCDRKGVDVRTVEG